MKKIIGALALASLTLGIASADVNFTLNYRTQMSAFSRVMSKNATTDGKSGDGIDPYVSHLFSHKGYGSSADNFSIKVSNDIAGATFRVDPDAANEAFTYDSTGKTGEHLKEYNGYIKIGNLTVSAGLFDGKMNGGYQLKSDADASNLGGETFAAYKLGSIFKGAITTQVDDITSFKGKQALTGFVSYDAAFGDSKVTVDAAAIGLNGNGFGGSADVKSGFALRLNAVVSKDLSAQFIIKQAADNERALALHVQPTFGNLKVTLGGALGFNTGDLEEYNADIRLYYKAGPFSFTSMNTISRRSDTATVSSADYAKHVGAYYTNTSNALKSVNNAASNRAMWNVVAIRYAVSDALAITAEAGDIIGFKSNGKTFRDDYGVEAFVAPGLQIFAGKNCSISTCARFGFSNLLLDSDAHGVKDSGKYENVGVTSLLVPVVFRVKL